MKKTFLHIFIFMSVATFAQTKSDTEKLYTDFISKSAQLKRSLDSVLNPIKYAKTLEEFLLATFPEESNIDGRWVYYKKTANIKKVEKPFLNKTFPNYSFFSVTMVNFLGWHINSGSCLILFDSLKRQVNVTAPLWYGGISQEIIRNFFGQNFKNKDSLLLFLQEINELFEIGSSYKFKMTSYADNLIDYDVGYFDGDSYSTNANGITSTINYNKSGVWRKIKVIIENFTIKSYSD